MASCKKCNCNETFIARKKNTMDFTAKNASLGLNGSQFLKSLLLNLYMK